MNSLKITEVLENFPFRAIRDRQRKVIEDTCNALNSGCKHIILEAPTGFGKSAVGISLARTLGTSYVCTATKDLQSQYARDFPFLRVAKGKNNFPCHVKEDFVRINKYRSDVVRQVRLVNATTSLVIMDHAYMTRLWKDLIARTARFSMIILF